MRQIKKYSEQLDTLQRHFDKDFEIWYKVKNKKGFKFIIYRWIIKKCLVVNMRLQVILLKRSFKLLSEIEIKSS